MKPDKSSSSSTDDGSTTTSTSSEEDISEDDSDDEFVDAPEASGTLISKFLDQTARLTTVANSITNREDLTLSHNWGGSPSTIELFETPPSSSNVSVATGSTTTTPREAISDTKTLTKTDINEASSSTPKIPTVGVEAAEISSGGSAKTTTLRTVNERARQSKLDETRRRLIHGEDDDDDDDDEILADEDGEDVRKSGGLTATGTQSSHSSNSPSHSSCDGISLSKQPSSSSTALTVQPFKVVEEQDNISLSRHSQYYVSRGTSATLVSTPSVEGLQVGRPPDIVSSCCTETPGVEVPPTPSTGTTISVPSSPKLENPQNSSTGGVSVQSQASSVPTPPPVPPPRRKKKKSVSGEVPRSKSPAVSIRSHVMMDTRNSISMYSSQVPSNSSTSNPRMLVITAQDEEKTRARTGPKVLTRTESMGLVGGVQASTSNPSSASNSLEKEKQQEQNIKEKELARILAVPTNPNMTKSTSLRARGNRRNRGDPVVKTSSIPGSYSLPGPLANVSSEQKKYSLPTLRTKTDTGKSLSDLEILEQVTVLNLDTGERIPLSSAEDKIPKCVNPLTLHIMRLTSEYVGEDKSVLDSDDDNSSSRVSTTTSEGFKRKRMQLKKLIGSVGRSALSKAKSFKAAAASSLASKSIDEADSEASSSLPLPQPQFTLHQQLSSQSHRQHVPPSSLRLHKTDYLEPPISADAASVMTTSSNTLENGPTILKMKASPKHKGPYDFENLELVQELTRSSAASTTSGADVTSAQTPVTPTNSLGPIWCMKWSNCGRLLAAAGQEKIIKVFVLKSQLNYFVDLIKTSKVSPTPSVESMHPGGSEQNACGGFGDYGTENTGETFWPFVPLSSYAGHTADLLDIAWSKSFFLLSSSMDRTVRLWHISRKECLCTFQHVDFVTAIAFHPRDDRYFLSGSLDSKVRIWNIPDKKVALWNEVPGPNNLITTANFCQNGKFAVVGTYDGRVIFYHTEQLKYHTQIILNKKKCVKISGIEPMPGEDKILVTSNDSRIRLFDLRDLSLTCKYTGSVTRSSQIKASFSHDGKFIISGSENNFIYLWRTAHEYVGFRGGARRDRNKYWEGVRVHSAVVTCAIFAPDPDLIIKEMMINDNRANPPSKTGPRNTNTANTSESSTRNSQLGYVIASADFMGQIKIFICRIKPKCSSLPVSAIA